jgi:hypothetical protein
MDTINVTIRYKSLPNTIGRIGHPINHGVDLILFQRGDWFSFDGVAAVYFGALAILFEACCVQALDVASSDFIVEN